MEKHLNLPLPSLIDVGTLPDRVYVTLEEAILQGKIKQGERLIEEDLASVLGVSRAPIREALRMMQKDGLVVISPRKGAVVNSISREDINQIYEIAGVLEGLAVELFCRRSTDKDLVKLQKIAEKMDEQAKSKDLSKYRKLNREFHKIFIEGSGNKKIEEIYGMFQKQISWFQNINLSLPGNREISLKEHKKILEAVVKKDPKAAGNAAAAHIMRAAKAYLNSEDRSR